MNTDCLAEIYSFLSIRDCAIFSMVCKEWTSLALSTEISLCGIRDVYWKLVRNARNNVCSRHPNFSLSKRYLSDKVYRLVSNDAVWLSSRVIIGEWSNIDELILCSTFNRAPWLNAKLLWALFCPIEKMNLCRHNIIFNACRGLHEVGIYHVTNTTHECGEYSIYREILDKCIDSNFMALMWLICDDSHIRSSEKGNCGVQIPRQSVVLTPIIEYVLLEICRRGNVDKLSLIVRIVRGAVYPLIYNFAIDNSLLNILEMEIFRHMRTGLKRIIERRNPSLTKMLSW